MKQSIVKFLRFKGKNLLFLAKDGVYYIAIKPICEAIGVDYIRQFKNISDDPILAPVLSKQTIQIPDDQGRNMICLPERFIYGWIFSINSNSKELIDYKLECYYMLFDHFNGSITDRHELLTAKVKTKARISELVTSLSENTAFTEWQELKAQEARLGIAFKQLDQRELREVADLFTGTSEIL